MSIKCMFQWYMHVYFRQSWIAWTEIDKYTVSTLVLYSKPSISCSISTLLFKGSKVNIKKLKIWKKTLSMSAMFYFMDLVSTPAIKKMLISRKEQTLDLTYIILVSTKNKSQKLTILFKLWTNKNHSYKHNEHINNQNIDNSECFGVKFVKIYPEMTSQYCFEKMRFWLII